MGSEGTAAPRAGRGSVAGAAGDAGVEYRRAVAAHAVAYGLAGVPLLGVGVPAADAHVDAVVLETEDPVDDIKVCFKSGWTAFLQAKRSLGKGSALTAAVAGRAERRATHPGSEVCRDLGARGRRARGCGRPLSHGAPDRAARDEAGAERARRLERPDRPGRRSRASPRRLRDGWLARRVAGERCSRCRRGGHTGC